MTVTVNLHNCASWVASTAYVVGDRRSNDTAPVKAYQCTTAGTSAGSGGPTGTGASISDGGAVWKYLSAVDYTTMAAAIAGLGTLTQPAIINMWNDAEWVMGQVAVSGNSTTATNTLTIQPAAGEGFRDNANASTNPLRYDVSKGVGISSNSNYGSSLEIKEDWVTVFGLQFRGNGSGNSQALSTDPAPTVNTVIDSCIADTSASTSTFANPANFSGGGSATGGVTVRNSVFIVNGGSNGIVSAFGVNAYNCTVVRVGATSPIGTAFGHNYGTTRTIKNCAVFGFTTLEGPGSTGTTYTTNATDLASPPAGWTGSLTYANQFVDTGATAANRDFRLKAGAGLLDVATTDTTNIPTAKDIVGTARPQGSAWDIGAWELVSAAPPPTSRPMLIPFGSGDLKGLATAAVVGTVLANPTLRRRQLLGGGDD